MKPKIERNKRGKLVLYNDLSDNKAYKKVATRELGLNKLKEWVTKGKKERTRDDLEKSVKLLRGELKGIGEPPSAYSDEELEAIGQAIVKWLDITDKDNGEPIVHLSQFYCDLLGWTPSEYAHIHKGSFERYRKLAEVKMGRRMTVNRDFPVAYGSRFLPLYFKEIAEHERQDFEHKIDYEVKAKKDMQQGEVPNAGLLTDLFGACKDVKEALEKAKTS